MNPSASFAFDSDALIYAASPERADGAGVRRLLGRDRRLGRRLGSVLLIPEVLPKPQRSERRAETTRLALLLARLDLRPLDLETAHLASDLGSLLGLRAPDAVHLATAVVGGADAFVTNNSKDFDADRIDVIRILRPGDLPA